MHALRQNVQVLHFVAKCCVCLLEARRSLAVFLLSMRYFIIAFALCAALAQASIYEQQPLTASELSVQLERLQAELAEQRRVLADTKAAAESQARAAPPGAFLPASVVEAAKE